MFATIRKKISDKIAQARGPGIKAKSARSSIVLIVGTIIERSMRLVRNMILARLLAPEDFGLMAIVMAVLMYMESFTDVGVKQSIIQNKGGAKVEYLNIAWWFQVVRGLGLFIIALLVAPAICRFYNKPELLNLLRVSFLSALLLGVTSPRVFVLEKEFRFVKAALLIQGSALLSTLITIGLAFYIRNVWVLVIGRVSEGLLLCVLSFVFCPFGPKFSIDRTSLNQLLRFCKGMLGLSFLTVITLQTDVCVLAKLMPMEQVGMYALALALAYQTSGLFIYTVGRVLLPVFAEKQDDKQFLCRVVLKMTKFTVVFFIPLIAFAAIFAGPILSVVYKPRYAAVAVPFGIMCATMFVRIQRHILGNIYLAIGQPHLHRRFVTLLAILIICLIYPGITLFGLVGAAGVLLLANVVALFMQVVWMRRAIGLPFKEYVLCWLPISFKQ